MSGVVGLYLYCLGHAGHPDPAGVQGMDESPVRALADHGLSVWVSDLGHAPTPSLANVRLHNTVIEAANRTETPLPFRFGQWFASDAELRRSIQDRHQLLERRLQTVQGALEYGLRVVDPAHQVAPPDRTSGTAYLESLARRARSDQFEQTRARELAAELRSWMGPLVRDQRDRWVGGGTLTTIAHLVDRHDTRSYDRKVREFTMERPGLRFLFTGPWPPYGFAE